MKGPTKAALVALAVIVALGVSARLAGGPFAPDPLVADASLGVVGIVGLALGRVAAALGMLAAPLLVMLRLLIVPLALAGLGWLAFRTFRGA
jgi:hypothetical protein